MSTDNKPALDVVTARSEMEVRDIADYINRHMKEEDLSQVAQLCQVEAAPVSSTILVAAGHHIQVLDVLMFLTETDRKYYEVQLIEITAPPMIDMKECLIAGKPTGGKNRNKYWKADKFGRKF
jgi:hypothetical protein